MTASKAQEQVAAASNSFSLSGGALTMSSILQQHDPLSYKNFFRAISPFEEFLWLIL